MSINEAISQGLMVTGVGLMIVFGVLIILMLALYAMKALFYKEPDTMKKEQKVEQPAQPTVQIADQSGRESDSSELIAVLTAAVAASLNTKTTGICIKSFRRIENASPAWNRAGVSEMINSRL